LEPVVGGASGQAEAEDVGPQIGRENWFLETDTKGHIFVFLDGEEFLFESDHKRAWKDHRRALGSHWEFIPHR